MIYNSTPIDKYIISAEKFGLITSDGINLLSNLFTESGYRIIHYSKEPEINSDGKLIIYQLSCIFRKKIVSFISDELELIISNITIPDNNRYYIGINYIEESKTYKIELSNDPSELEYTFITVENKEIIEYEIEWSFVIRNAEALYKYIQVHSEYQHGNIGVIFGGSYSNGYLYSLDRFNFLNPSETLSYLNFLSTNYFSASCTSNSILGDCLSICGIYGNVNTNSIYKFSINNLENKISFFNSLSYTDYNGDSTSNGDLNTAIYLYSYNIKTVENEEPDLSFLKMESIDFKTIVPIAEHGFLSESNELFTSNSNQVLNDGIYCGGLSKSVSLSKINYFRIDIKSNASYFGELTTPSTDLTSVSNGTLNDVLFIGGVKYYSIDDNIYSVYLSDISKINIKIKQNAKLINQLDTDTYYVKATSNAEGNQAAMVSGFISGVSLNKVQILNMSNVGDRINDFCELSNFYRTNSMTSSNG